jgi:hypothetical protein
MFGASDLVSDDEVPIPHLHVLLHGDLLLLLQPCYLQPALIKIPFRSFHPVLLWFRDMVMRRLLSSAQYLLAFPPSLPLPLFTLDLPRRLAALADALSGMVNLDLLLLSQAA